MPMTGEAATSSTRDIEIPAIDGFALAATVYEPDALTDKVVLITGGTGVLRCFYDPFACFLQRQGFGVVTFDYRGIGDSRPLSLKGFWAQMHEWPQNRLTRYLPSGPVRRCQGRGRVVPRETTRHIPRHGVERHAGILPLVGRAQIRIDLQQRSTGDQP